MRPYPNSPRTRPEHDPAARVVIELDDAVRRHQRVMVWQRNHAGAEFDPARAFRRDRDELLRRTDQLHIHE